MLGIYRTCNSTLGFLKYEFYNKLLGGIILLRVIQGVIWNGLKYIYIYIYILIGCQLPTNSHCCYKIFILPYPIYISNWFGHTLTILKFLLLSLSVSKYIICQSYLS